MSGTPGYMAPEQLLRGQTSVQSDLYSLGLILYELFAGKSAFKAQSMGELRRLHEESSTIVPPSAHTEGIDAAVERAILLALEHDPEHRPRSAVELAASLPGGNPLAAGEMPSPELVAASGPNGALSPKAAGLLLAIVVACVVIVFLASSKSQLINRFAAPKSPEVLAERSRQIMASFGYDEKMADSAFGFDTRPQNALRLTPNRQSVFRRWTLNASAANPGNLF